MTVGLVGRHALFAASSTDYDMRIVPASSEVTIAGSVDLAVTLTTRIDGTQGWSFGVKIDEPLPTDVTFAAITDVSLPVDVETVKDGAPADFKTTTAYDAGGSADRRVALFANARKLLTVWAIAAKGACPAICGGRLRSRSASMIDKACSRANSSM